jgi:hypothetical protein
VRSGLPAVLTSAAVDGHAAALYGPDGQPAALPQDHLAAERGGAWPDGGRVELDGIDWFDDAALIRDAPEAAWEVALGPDTEQPGVWLSYTPQTGLVEATHLDEAVLVPLAWTGPGAPPPGAADQLQRLRTAHALLHPPGPPAPGPGPAAGHHGLRRIIGGQRYDTAAAALVADVSPPGRSRRDFDHEDTGLYRTAGGAWFLAGSGGPRSRWGASAGRNAWTGGEGIAPLRPEQALDLLESLNTVAATEAIERCLPDRITDAAAAPAPLRTVPAARPGAAVPPAPGGPGHRVRGPQR